MKLTIENILEIRYNCLAQAVELVREKHLGQKTDTKVYNSDIITLATSFEKWYVRGLINNVPIAQSPKQAQQPQPTPAKTAGGQIAQETNKSPMEDIIDKQRATREQFAEDFTSDKFKPEDGEKLAVQKGLGFSLKK